MGKSYPPNMGYGHCYSHHSLNPTSEQAGVLAVEDTPKLYPDHYAMPL